MGNGLRVAVLLGGRSSEREVSLRSGEAVYRALLQKGYTAWKIDAGGDFIRELLQDRPDVVFIALHGRFGEDGTVQGLLELLDLPYTGSGVLASALAMDKIMTKRVLLQAGLPTAAFRVVRADELEPGRVAELAAELLVQFRGRLVVKVPEGGSSIGVYWAGTVEETATALLHGLAEGPEVLVEKHLPGVELTAPVLGNRQPRVLPLIEILPAKGCYDYEAKYTPGGSRHIIPPRVEPALQREVEELALAAYRLLGCAGCARIDFKLDETGRPMILEVNTVPGFTETSLVPDSARAAGIEFPDLVAELVELALERRAQR
ncbi:MAG: D-alanine--D-alanine ligase [Clostridia bacterium]|nr:D-alanine--D-alanine ligase [Clostridia bacterium]MDH7572163.1 D-alanine--D-alanine ligase [Clostridia bacterium]